MDHKGIAAAVEVKSTDRGEVEAVFSRFSVEDHDKDLTLPGAFEEGAPVAISAYGHKTWPQMGGLPPVGKGTIKTTPDEAVLRGQFFLDTSHGRDAFNTVKNMGELQEWSYGYDVLDGEPRPGGGRILKKLRVHEVSPVFQGAGIGTRTLAVKALVEQGYDPARALATVLEHATDLDPLRVPIKSHTTDTVSQPWNPADELAAIGDESVDALRSVFAMSDPTVDPGTKSAYMFPHHHGPGGPANIRACVMGIAEINADVKGGWREGAYAHLAQHIRDAGKEPSELRTDQDSTLKMLDEGAAALAGIARFRRRLGEVDATRALKGKRLGSMTVEVYDWINDELKAGRYLLDTPEDVAAQEYARFVSLTYRQGEPGT